MNEEFEYLVRFAKEINDPFELRQLRALWTAYCLHHDIDVDTGSYDLALRSVWDSVEIKGSFDDFDYFMCEFLI